MQQTNRPAGRGTEPTNPPAQQRTATDIPRPWWVWDPDEGSRQAPDDAAQEATPRDAGLCLVDGDLPEEAKTLVDRPDLWVVDCSSALHGTLLAVGTLDAVVAWVDENGHGEDGP